MGTCIYCIQLFITCIYCYDNCILIVCDIYSGHPQEALAYLAESTLASSSVHLRTISDVGWTTYNLRLWYLRSRAWTIGTLVWLLGYWSWAIGTIVTMGVLSLAYWRYCNYCVLSLCVCGQNCFLQLSVCV